MRKSAYLCNRKSDKDAQFELYFFIGVIAQLVEQRTENPCVPGSIPGDTTAKDS